MIQRHEQTHSYLDLFRAFTAVDVAPPVDRIVGSNARNQTRISDAIRPRSDPGCPPGIWSDRGSCSAGLHLPRRPGSGSRRGIHARVRGYRENSINMTPETLESAITPRSAAVVITHQFGLPCDIDRMLDICRATACWQSKRRRPSAQWWTAPMWAALAMSES